MSRRTKGVSAFETRIHEAKDAEDMTRKEKAPKHKSVWADVMGDDKVPADKKAKLKKKFSGKDHPKMPVTKAEFLKTAESSFEARIAALSENGYYDAVDMLDEDFIDEEVLGDAAITEMMVELGLDEDGMVETVLLDESLKKMVFGVWRTVKAIGQSAKSKETGKGLGKGQAGTKGQKKGKKRGFVAGAMRTAMASKIKKHRRGEKTKSGKGLTKASKNMREPETKKRKKDAEWREIKKSQAKDRARAERNKKPERSAAERFGGAAFLKRSGKKESAFDARIASLSEKLDPTSQSLWNALQHLKDEYEISPSSGVRIGNGRMDMRMSEAKSLERRGVAIIDKSSKGTYAYAQEDEMYKLINNLKGQTGERWEDVESDASDISEARDAYSMVSQSLARKLAKDYVKGKDHYAMRSDRDTKLLAIKHFLKDYDGDDADKIAKEVVRAVSLYKLEGLDEDDLDEMKMGTGVKKEFVFSSKEKAQAFVDKIKSEGRRFKGKPKVKKTKGWRTFSAVVHFFALGDTVGLKYTPEKDYYRDIMRDLKESLDEMKMVESSTESSFDARIAGLGESASDNFGKMFKHLKIILEKGLKMHKGNRQGAIAYAKEQMPEATKSVWKRVLKDLFPELPPRRFEDVDSDEDDLSEEIVKSLAMWAKSHGGKSSGGHKNGVLIRLPDEDATDAFIQDLVQEYPGIKYKRQGYLVVVSPADLSKFDESLDEAVNFKGAAKVLLKKATDSKRPIGYTGYLRAVIQGNGEQATHMRTSKTYKDDASQAMQDLIDMAGKAKYDESLDEMFATLPKGVPNNYVTQNAIAIPAKITKVGNKVEFQFRDKNGLRVFKEVMKRGTVVLKDIDEKNNKVTISISMLKMVYVNGMKNTLENVYSDVEESYDYKIYWDDQDPNTEGWHVEVRKDGKYHDDSQKIGFGLDVDDYGRRDKRKLLRDVKDMYESVQEGDLEEATLTKGAKASLEAAMVRLELVGKHFEKTNSNIYKEIMKARDKLKKGITWLRYKEESTIQSSKGANLLKSLVNELDGLAKALLKDGYDSSAEMVELARGIIKKNITRLTGKKAESVEEGVDQPADNSALLLDESIAKTILMQLGGNKFLAMTGAKNLVSTGKGLMFNVGRNSKKISKVVIDLDPSDTYSLKFYKGKGVRMTVVKEVDMIYADMLQDVFTMHTGLDTHL